jgi:hypothetical protein
MVYQLPAYIKTTLEKTGLRRALDLLIPVTEANAIVAQAHHL